MPDATEPIGEPHEGCARRGGVCDCGTMPCALDNPELAALVRAAATREHITPEQLLNRLEDYRAVVPPPGPARDAALAAAKRRLGL